jgi:hypothetical protein
MWWLAALCLCAAAACSSKEESREVGGDTHWLQACDDDGECGRGSCSCGLCTEPCTRDAECAGGPAAQCYATASPGVRAACAAGTALDPSATGICLAQCSADRECTHGQQCIGGACAQEREPSDASAPSRPDATVLTAPDSGLPTTRASQFADLQSNVGFDASLPAGNDPERDFVGSAEALLGTWSDPTCDPADGNKVTYSGGCASLVIERSGPNGEIRGRLRVRNDIDMRPWNINWQEFAPAVDPDVGYPVEITPQEYVQVSQGPSFGPYSMLDPFFDGTRLQFWVAPMELWDGWCKLQTSYRVPGGDPPYQCVPDGAAYGDPVVDYGKLVLCTSEWSTGSCELQNCDPAIEPSCTPPGTITIGCGCWSKDGYAIDRPECTPANCACDQDGCRANWHEGRVDMEATWDGEAITVRQGFNPKRNGAAMSRLVREPSP